MPDSQYPLAGLSAFGSYLRELRVAQELSLADVRRRLQGLDVAVRLRDLQDWEVGVRRPNIRAKAALIAVLNGSPAQADMLVLYDLHAGRARVEAYLRGDEQQLAQLAQQHQAYGADQARTWLRRRTLWLPPDTPSIMPAWLMDELSGVLGRLYAREPAAALRLLREAIHQLG